MNADRHTVVTRQSWGSRLGNSLKGVIVGLILFLLAFPLLFWNEGRAVRRQRALEEGAATVASVASARVEPGNEGQLIHLSGSATVSETLTDVQFEVAVTALRLRRQVEMYQWKEDKESKERKKLGGGTETVTTYTYSKTWRAGIIDSMRFEQPEGHENPITRSFESRELSADTVTLGAFRLPSRLVDRIDSFEPLSAVQTSDAGSLPAAVQRHGDGFYVGADPSSPRVGDLRVFFSVVWPTDVSIVARQVGDSLGPYQTSTGGNIPLLEEGSHNADQMFQSAISGNRLLTWVLRGVGFVLMILGLSMIMGPISVLADVIPILGNIAAAGTGIIAFLLAAVMSLVTVAVAWLAYRPLLGGTLLGIALVCLVVTVRRLRAPSAAAA